jgi:hypothetical protein
MGITKDAEKGGIELRAGIVIDSAQMAAVRGAQSGTELPKNVEVGVGIAGGNTQIDGVVYGDAERVSPQDRSLDVLADIFKHLNKSNQIKLISSAQRLLDQEKKLND